MTELQQNMSHLKERFDLALQAEVGRWTSWPQDLRDACLHVLFGGGKRVRPVVSLLIGKALGSSIEAILPWSMAVELIHTYSLVHDDLPAMDDDDLRRGRPTCHIKFGEANAILAGDALLTQAFVLLAEQASWTHGRRIELIRLLGETSGGSGMVGGQVYDISGELADLESVLHMQSLKTGALIRAAAEGGAIAAGAAGPQIDAARSFGVSLGLLFQLTDDRLDREQDLADGGNNVLHHVDDAEVQRRIDAVAGAALRAANDLSEDAQLLKDLVGQIQSRDV